MLTKQKTETKKLHDEQEQEYKNVVDELKSKENEISSEQEREDAEEEAQLSNLSSIPECDAFEVRLKEQIASVAETDPDRRRRLERLLSKLEFKKMEIVKRTEAKAMVEGAKARNDEAEVDRIKAKFASDMQLLAKSADSEKKRQKASLQDRLQKKRERRMRDLQHKHETELQKMTDEHQTEASEIQDRLDDHDDLARIIHEVKTEANDENDINGTSAEAEALEDEQARMREVLRVKQEEEATAIKSEEEEDSMIASVSDPYALHLFKLRIENDMQMSCGAIDKDGIYKRRINGYNQIDGSIKQLLQAREQLNEKKRNFSTNNRENKDVDVARRDAEINRIEEMVKRLNTADTQVSSSLDAAEADMEKTRSATEDKLGKTNEANTPRGSAKQKVEQQQQQADAAQAEAMKLRESGSDQNTIQSAELRAAAAFEQLESFEKEYEEEAEKQRASMSDRQQRQRDRMLVKLEQKKRRSNRIKNEKLRSEKIKQLQSSEELKRKENELKAQGALNESKVAEMQAEAKAKMIEHEAHVEEQANHRKSRMEARMKAKRSKKKNA